VIARFEQAERPASLAHLRLARGQQQECLTGLPLRDQDVPGLGPRAIDDPLEVLQFVVRPAIKEGNASNGPIGMTLVERQTHPLWFGRTFVTTVRQRAGDRKPDCDGGVASGDPTV
jgi:hypothetical protein